MPGPVRYHVEEQHACALLDPLHASLHALESRAQHYVEHLPMSAEDRETIRRAWEALAGARQEIERLRRESVETAQS
jgi:hypothetical protein